MNSAAALLLALAVAGPSPSQPDAGWRSQPARKRTVASDAGTRPDKGRAGGDAGAGPRAGELACVDRWLADHKLDRYGSPEGTMYAGGTPLFDERTGQTTDRLDHLYRVRPEARKACAGR